jgi:hypothetical protein
MYYQRSKDSTKVIIQDVHCWVPPPGWVFDIRSGYRKMVEVGIYSRSDDPTEQYWEIPPEPKDYKMKRQKEKRRQKSTPGHQDVELTKYANQEWFRRLNGFWFMNNGTPTYITGVHYFYLAHWTLNTGVPLFRLADQLYFYFWASCVEDPRCLGMVNFANRQSGKSFRSGCILYERISRTRSSHGGIQSKNKEDAGSFFTKCVTTPLTKLKDFFIPIYDKQLGLDAKSTIRFFKKLKPGEEDFDDAFVQPLNSEIDFREPSAKAYDGSTMLLCIEDEFGKLDTEHDLMERHSTIRWCIRAGGKLLYCTTVEDMASGKSIMESKELFDKSDPAKRLPSGKTESGLYRFRLPAYETYSPAFDKYGMPRVEETKAEFQDALDALLRKGDFVGYASFKRKQPFSDEDIFRVAAKAPIFDIIKISEQLASISCRTESELYKRGNFVWQGGKRDTRVVFREMKNGRFLVRQLMEGEGQNLRKPINRHRFAGGIDPFEQKKAARPSDGAAYIFKKFDQNSPNMSNSPVVEYCARPQPSVFFEDMVMMAVYYGCEVNIENNKTGLIDYFQERGYTEFLYWVHGARTAGTYASDSSKQQAYEIASNYISDDCELVFFPKLLEDLSMFDLADSTKFDRAMAFLWTMFSVGNQLKMSDIEAPPDVNDIVRTYKLRRA